jgi:hypothetical protein
MSDESVRHSLPPPQAPSDDGFLEISKDFYHSRSNLTVASEVNATFHLK